MNERLIDLAVKNFNLNVSIINLLIKKPYSISELCKLLKAHQTTITREVNKLKADGFITEDKMGNKKKLIFNKQKIEEYTKKGYMQNIPLAIGVINYFLKHKIDKPTTARRIIEELRQIHKT